MVTRLRGTGMPIRDVKRYAELVRAGDGNEQERLALLHTHRERRLRTTLLRNGGSDIAVVGVPWQLEAPAPDRVLAEEEPAAA